MTRVLGLTIATTWFVLGLSVQPAAALPQLWKEFEAKYVAPKPDAPFAKAAAEAKCNVCHVKGESKKERNPYGQAVGKLLGEDIKGAYKKDEAAAIKRVQEALEKAGKEKVDAKDDKSPTFAARIAKGELPGAVAAAKPAQDNPKPAPMPEPKPTVKVDVAPPSLEEQKAIATIEKVGGTVYPLAQKDPRKSVAFHLSGTGLDDAGLSYVASVADVYSLNLKDTQITDAGLAHIAGLKSLVRLHLERTGITDEGLKHLAGLENLEYLNLYGTQVTDAGLEHLAGLKNLKKVYLWMSKVSDEGVKKLQEKLPELTIVR